MPDEVVPLVRCYRVEFWVLGGAGSPAGIQTEWVMHDHRWAERWDQISAIVSDVQWETLGGMWARTQWRIEEYECSQGGAYSLQLLPANRM